MKSRKKSIEKNKGRERGERRMENAA